MARGPGRAASARLGRLLAGMRAAAAMDTGQLAAASIPPDHHGCPGCVPSRAAHITAAEAGTWQPRELWAALAAALGADGTLLRAHDTWHAPPGPQPARTGQPAAGQQPPQPTGYPGLLDQVTDAVRAEITGGAIAPGALLDCQQIARRHGVAGTGHLVISVLARLRAEGIVHLQRRHRFAAPAGAA